MKYMFWDTEFHSTSEPTVTPVSASFRDTQGVVRTFWLESGAAKIRCADFMRKRNKEGYIFVAHNTIAESRFIESLPDLDCMDFQMICTYVDWKLVSNHNDRFKYGCYYDKDGTKRYSDPGRMVHGERIDQKDAKILDHSLDAMVAALTEKQIDKGRKVDTKSIILSRSKGAEKEGVPFTFDERHAILDYNESDVAFLPECFEKLKNYQMNTYGLSEEDYCKAAIKRARYMQALAKAEGVGMPVHRPFIDNISGSYNSISNLARNEMNAVWPLYEENVDAKLAKGKKEAAIKAIKDLGLEADWPRTDKGALRLTQSELGKYWSELKKLDPTLFDKIIKYPPVRKMKNMVDLVEKLGLTRDWPRTGNIKADTLSFDSKTIDQYRHIPEINTYRTTSRTLQQMKWFRPEAVKEFNQKIGSDDRIRFWFNPFGSQTGRNQPPAKQFVLAMSSWLRCIMRAPKGKAITTIDWASQEFVLAASLSGDTNMLEAYKSGDPYLYFAKLAGAVPWEGTKKEYATERDLFKAVVLGLQYGLGVVNLSLALTSKMKREVSVQETMNLIDKHKGAFPVFWQWCEDIRHHYFEAKQPLILGCNMSDKYASGWVGDLWTINTDNPNPLSINNAPVQGTGASIMRSAVIRATEAGLNLVTPLHDALYIIHDEEDTESPKILAKCMSDAVAEYIPDEVRMDVDTYTHDKLYVPPKGQYDFEQYKTYILGDEKVSF